jgi:hypothetical protein
MQRVSLPDGTILEFPDGMSDADMGSAIRRNFPQYAEPSRPAEQQRSVVEDIGRGVGLGARQFIEGAGGLVDLAASPFRWGANQINEALGGAPDYFQPAAPGLADALGLPKPETENERTMDRVGQAVFSTLPTMGAGLALQGARGAASLAPTIAQRTGAFLTSAPVMQGASAAASGVGQAAAERAGFGPVGQVAGSLAAGASPLAVAGAAARMGTLPSRLYASAIKPSTTKFTPAERAELIQTGIAEGIIPTQGGVDRLTGRIGGLSDEVDSLVNARAWLEGQGYVPKTISTQQIARDAKDFVWGNSGNTATPTPNRNTINREITDFLDSYGPGNLSTADAQKIKRATYKNINNSAYGELQAPQIETQKALAHGLMQGVERNIPEVAPLNAEIGRLTNLRDVLEPAAARIDNANIISLTPAVMAANGSPTGAITSGLISMGASPKVKAGAAIALNRLGSPFGIPVSRYLMPPENIVQGYAAQSIPVTGGLLGEIMRSYAAQALPSSSIAVRNYQGGSRPNGMIEPGNIDLNARPIVENQNGSYSTVLSRGFNVDGREVLLPTVSDDGRILTDDEAVEQYRRTGKHLGIFDTAANSTAYAENLHEDQDRQYGSKRKKNR